MEEQIYTEQNYTLEIIHHIGALENSIHFIFDHTSKQCALVDPAWEVDLFLDKINNKGYILSDIWLTHWHPDHMNSVDQIVDKTGAKIAAGIDEIPYLKIKNPVHTLADGDVLSLGKTKARVITTPGHTAGGICYLLDGHLIVGDTLFIYGAGHCALPGADAKIFFNSMKKLKTAIPDETLLHCGHDYGTKITTTMAEQKQTNPFLMINNQSDFVRYRNQIHDQTRRYPMDAMNFDELSSLLSSG